MNVSQMTVFLWRITFLDFQCFSKNWILVNILHNCLSSLIFLLCEKLIVNFIVISVFKSTFRILRTANSTSFNAPIHVTSNFVKFGFQYWKLGEILLLCTFLNWLNAFLKEGCFIHIRKIKITLIKNNSFTPGYAAKRVRCLLYWSYLQFHLCLI